MSISAAGTKQRKTVRRYLEISIFSEVVHGVKSLRDTGLAKCNSQGHQCMNHHLQEDFMLNFSVVDCVVAWLC